MRFNYGNLLQTQIYPNKQPLTEMWAPLLKHFLVVMQIHIYSVNKIPIHGNVCYLNVNLHLYPIICRLHENEILHFNIS